MKLIFASDLHGSLFYTKKLVSSFLKEDGKYMVLLGDILYHGPRNDLPKEYNPKEVAALLNQYSSKIIAVRGNCDAEVDQMLLDFPMMSDYSTILYQEKRIFITHGHIYNKDNLPKVMVEDIVIHGHTHIQGEHFADGIRFLNPGSVAIPKGGNKNTYAVLENNVFMIKDFEGEEIWRTEL